VLLGGAAHSCGRTLGTQSRRAAAASFAAEKKPHTRGHVFRAACAAPAAAKGGLREGARGRAEVFVHHGANAASLDGLRTVARRRSHLTHAL
jgi:hypothetical protein